jgi:excisionase family DNA binding protein
MPQKYYNVKETAATMGITEDDVRQMLERRELYGYRDGADWKFKTEDIDRLAKQRAEERAQTPAQAEDEGDVLLSDVTLGESDPGLSGTVIGTQVGKHASPVDSDIKLADSDIKLGESEINLTSDAKPAARGKDEVDSKVSQFEALDLTLDQDLSLEDSSLAARTAPKATESADSAVDLSGKVLDDDDLVLSGSGTGSDVSIGGDSGISLVDPADSGLSLEEPLNLAASGEESLELGEDDLLTLASDTATGAKLKGEDDFQLTPKEESGDADDSESGSQVIALDTDGASAGGSGTVAAMLDEDIGTEHSLGLGAALPLGSAGMSDVGLEAQPGGLVAGASVMQPMILLPEAPYSIWNIVGLVFCTLILMLVGMMMYDLLRNMWSWDQVHPVNKGIMDWILSLVEK